MRIVFACLFALVGWAQSARADIAFNIVKVTPGAIEVGQSAVFNINVFTFPGASTQVAGIDFRINANDPTFTGTTTAGRFTAGTSNLFGGVGFLQAFPSTFQVFSRNNGANITLGNTPTLLATVTLSAAGATPGNYTLGLSNLAAVDAGFNAIPTIPASLAYSIVPATAVPEPSSLLLVVGAVGLVGARRYLKKRAS